MVDTTRVCVDKVGIKHKRVIDSEDVSIVSREGEKNIFVHDSNIG